MENKLGRAKGPDEDSPSSVQAGSSQRLRGWRRISLVGLSIGVGIVLALTVVVLIYNYYEDRARPARTWKEINAESVGIRFTLTTEWREGEVFYRFQVRPNSKDLVTAFEKAAQSSSRSFTVLLYDSAGMRMCEQKVEEFTRELDQHGGVSGLESVGTFSCSLRRYSDSRDWSVHFEFPRLADTKQPTSDIFVPLPDGRYVRVPAEASPQQLAALRSKLAIEIKRKYPQLTPVSDEKLVEEYLARRPAMTCSGSVASLSPN